MQVLPVISQPTPSARPKSPEPSGERAFGDAMREAADTARSRPADRNRPETAREPSARSAPSERIGADPGSRAASGEPATEKSTDTFNPTVSDDGNAETTARPNDKPVEPTQADEATVDAGTAPGTQVPTEAPTAPEVGSLVAPSTGEAESGQAVPPTLVASGPQTTAANVEAVDPTIGPVTPHPDKAAAVTVAPAPMATVPKPGPMAPPVTDVPPQNATIPGDADPVPAPAPKTAAPVPPPAALGTEAVSAPPTVIAAAKTAPMPTSAAGPKPSAPSGKANTAPAEASKQPATAAAVAELAPEDTLSGSPKNPAGTDLGTAPRAIPALSTRVEPAPTPINATFFAEGAPGQLNQAGGLITLPTGAGSVDLVSNTAAQTTYTRGAEPAQPPVQQVAIQISRATQEGTDRVSVQLKPAALGRISIELEVGHDNRVIAVIAAERTETMELLQRDAKALERALNEAGLKTDSGSLSFSLKEESGRQNPDGDNANATNGTLILPDEADGPPPATVESHYNRQTAHGGIDIRI